MKFSIGDMLLLVTLIAVTFWAFSVNKTLGRHLLLVALSLSGATICGLTLKGRPGIRTRCAIGSIFGALLYGTITYLSKDWIFEQPPYFTRQSLFVEPSRWSRDLVGMTAFSVFFFSTLAPFLIVHIEKHELTEDQKIDISMSRALLAGIALCYLLMVLDGWRKRYLESHWMTVFLLLTLLFVMVTFPWIGKHYRSLKMKDSEPTTQPDTSGGLPSRVKPD